MLTAQNLGYVHFHWRDWWPGFIILFGVSIVMRGLLPRADAHRQGALAATRSLMQMDNGDFAFS